MLHYKIILSYIMSETLNLEELGDLCGSACAVKSSEIMEVTIN
jgi:hypothetical protein